jgi:hypothetical protein
MSYEAVGRTSEACQVYQTLSTCRMEDVKFDAKRLLFGMEAMAVMRDVSSEFSRKKITSTFVDTTGFSNIAQHFDNVYQTAYIDLDSGFYKRLTESVVRSTREARQILLKATGKGEVGRLRVVQALRSMSRHFDDSLQAEIAAQKAATPVAMMNGKPIMAPVVQKEVRILDEFVLASADQMMTNLQGKWRLQLLADKKGEGVTFFNTTRTLQEFLTEEMTFSASGPSGFLTIEKAGGINLDEQKRVLSRVNVQNSGAGSGIFGIFGDKTGGFAGAVSYEQQIITVDSILLITKCVNRRGNGAEKEHFGVWRRVIEGTP